MFVFFFIHNKIYFMYKSTVWLLYMLGNFSYQGIFRAKSEAVVCSSFTREGVAYMVCGLPLATLVLRKGLGPSM